MGEEFLSITFCLREYLPLKQGLRLHYLKTITCRQQTPRVSSIKTRIKTGQSLDLWQSSCAPRVSSIKTRIKTRMPLAQQQDPCYLREYLPLKQGLRQACNSFISTF